MSSHPHKIPGPDHPITVEPAKGRVVVRDGDRVIVDTRRALVLTEASYPAVFYVPREDADMASLRRSDRHTYCPYKGEASYYSLPGNEERAIAAIDPKAWTTIKYTDALYDQESGTWVSKAEVAEVPFTAFTSKTTSEQVAGRLVVRRIPDLNPKTNHGQDTLFTTWRFHAFFTTTPLEQLGTVTADQVHRRHAIIENVHADLKASALAHLPSGVFNANAVWLTCAVMAFNLTRAAATLTKAPPMARATTSTIRRTLIAVPARVASTARQLHLHLPTHWPWETAFSTLYDTVMARPARAT